MAYPKVTVITATYNLIRAGRAETIVQAIESVHAQKYEGEIEHLIMDGASNDGTLDLLAPFSEKGWIKVVSEKDRGLYDAMNKGIAIATGKYTVFLNSDDYWSSEFAVQKSVEALEREQADFSYGKFRMEDNGNIGQAISPELGKFFFRMPFGHPTMFTRTDVLKECGGFNTQKYKSAADYDLILNIILAGKKSVFVDLDFVIFRTGGFSSDVTLGNSEVIDSMYSAYGKIFPLTLKDCADFFQILCFPHELYQIIREKVSPEVSYLMAKEIDKSCKIGSMCYFNYRYYSKNFFWRYLFYKACSILHINKKRSIKKMMIEKSKIDRLHVDKQEFLGVCIYKKYYDSKIKSYHVFNLPVLTIMEK